MIFAQIYQHLPSFRDVLSAISYTILGGLLVVGLYEIDQERKAAPFVDSQFVTIGREYGPKLQAAYSLAWENGAKVLDAKDAKVADALKAVSDSWATSRTELFAQTITPALSRIVPESTKDADVTPAERAALAKAFRGLARGLSH